MCGEMSGEVKYTQLLLGLGLRSFSVSPKAIPEVKKLVRLTNLEDANKVYSHISGVKDNETVEQYLNEITRKLMPELY